ncbi:MAG TPA: DNA mismatch repair protein MutS, partial [Limnochordia bacterium]|nr:DNA mismatch repair protein MutS [Limnochordia bacterium]
MSTPMMAQYQALKASYPDALLFFRLGDFYELFGEDAEVASRVLQITLTGRDAGKGERIPMCGVPHHAADGYLATLVEAGYKVAVCEQLEDPKVAKGLVERDVIRVVTPGTLTSERSLAAGESRYLAALGAGRDGFGLAVLELSTGEFWCLEARDRAALRDELERLGPSEVLIDEALAQDEGWRRFLTERLGAALSEQPRAAFAAEASVRRLCEHFDIVSLEGCGCADLPLASGAAACALAYVERTQKTTLAHIARLSTRPLGEAMHLDTATRRALELTQTLRDNQRRGSLLWVLDATVTALGARTLRRWIEAPLTDAGAVRARLSAVAALHADPLARAELRSALGRVYDIERLVGKAACRTAGGRDLAALRDSLAALPQIRAQAAAVPCAEVAALALRIDPHEALHEWLQRALVEDPPLGVQEGGLIKAGYDAAIDELREVAHGGKEWLARFERQERETTGVKSLKVGYNKVFGYYIEVTKANLGLVPEHYLRKQTLANGERFVTEALKERESLILGAEERLIALEYDRFNELRAGVAEAAATLQETARALSELDALCALAQVAQERRYVKPEIVAEDLIEITAGRHPVVEALQPDVRFVPNDCRLGAGRRTLILTGPNMAGKSTYLRQIALIGLMAQIGSFVPAEGAKLGVID